jgi:hypothetical protein
MSDVTGSSSSTIITTGVLERPRPAADVASVGKTSRETGEVTRNTNRTTSGTGDRTVAKERTARARA